jgi:hypothetical protein
LKSLIRRVDSEHGAKALRIAYEALPDCKPEQIVDFKARLDAAQAGTQIIYNLCEFPDPWHEDQFSDNVEGLDDIVGNIPETFALTKELEGTADTKGIGPEVLKGQLRLSRQLMTLSLDPNCTAVPHIDICCSNTKKFWSVVGNSTHLGWNISPSDEFQLPGTDYFVANHGHLE